MSEELKAITAYVETIRVGLPEGIDGEGPIRQALGEIVAEATALDSALDSLRDDVRRVDEELESIRGGVVWCRKELEPQP